MAFTVKTAYYAGAAWTEATETNAIAYTTRLVMNAPSEAVVYLNDVDFASTRKYTAPGAVGHAYAYFGLNSRCTIEEPTGTTRFCGPITHVLCRPEAGIVELHCKDWLHQLNTRKIQYDTRADLDGAGLRESLPYRMDAAGPYEHPIVLAAAGHWRLYDTVAGSAWAADAWNTNAHYLVFANKMAGQVNFWHGINELVSSVGTQTNTYDHTWANDYAVWQIESSVDAEDPEVVFKVKTHVDPAKITRVDVDLRWMHVATLLDGADSVLLQAYDQTGAAYRTLRSINITLGLPADEQVWNLPNILERWANLGVNTHDYIDANGDIQFKIYAPTAAAHRCRLNIYYLRVTYYCEDVVGNSTAYLVHDSDANWLEVETSLITADIDKHAPYSLSRLLNYYTENLVTTYDTVQALTMDANNTISTTVVGRHFYQMTPLEILRALAEADAADFWYACTNAVPPLHYFRWYNDVSGVAPVGGGAGVVDGITDASVVTWLAPQITAEDIGNEITVEGMRYSDQQVETSTSDATSQGYYGIYSRILENPAIYTLQEATAVGTAVVGRFKDPHIQLGYTVNGWPDQDIGDGVRITSAHLGINLTTYRVVETRYDSRTGVGVILLAYEHVGGLRGGLQLEDAAHHITGSLANLSHNTSFFNRQTETWT